jgi:hypothetical protein
MRLSFSGNINICLFFRPSPSDYRPPGEKTSGGRRFRFIRTHSSILQDGARHPGQIRLRARLGARQDMRDLSFVKTIPTKAPLFRNKQRRTGHPKF